jgi:hypothetical protein
MKLCIEQGVDFAMERAKNGMKNPAKKHAKNIIKTLVISFLLR